MTTQTTTQTVTQVRPVGRPLTAKGKRVKNAVLRFVEEKGALGFTVREISAATKQSKITVSNHINLMVQRGELVRASRKNGEGRGRPETVFKSN